MRSAAWLAMKRYIFWTRSFREYLVWNLSGCLPISCTAAITSLSSKSSNISGLLSICIGKERNGLISRWPRQFG
jgi:hypothetical protein